MKSFVTNFGIVFALLFIFWPWAIGLFDISLWIVSNHFPLAEWLGVQYTEQRVVLMAVWPIVWAIIVVSLGGGL